MKFKLGEIAIVGHVKNRRAARFVGMECEIILTPSASDRYLFEFDKKLLAGKYLVCVAGEYWECTEEKLRKKRPPEQPADQDFQEWFNKTIVTPDLEKTMERTLNNVYRYRVGMGIDTSEQK